MSQPDRRRITVLGSTGSIGRNTMDVVKQLGGRDAFEVEALSGHGNLDLLARQAIECGARLAVTADPARYTDLKERLAATGIDVAAGPSGLIEAAGRDTGWVMAAIVGNAGLPPALVAAERGADIALANKECLVSAGRLFLAAVGRGGGRLIPVDSEHSAIFQVFDRDQRHALERIVLTASGGPFRTWSREEMAGVTAATARVHPNWSMGVKISIDSASMFNKAREMIEARHLFDVHPDEIEVVVHPQSIIHSMVGYCDGSVIAQMGAPDMRGAIAYALSYPRRASIDIERLDFTRLARLDFEAPDEARFPALRLARVAMQRGGLQAAVMSAAQEQALDAFIDDRIGFLDMAEIVESVMDAMGGIGEAADMEDVFAADEEARHRAAKIVAERQKAA